MKILMTTDPLGGVWPYTLELCAGLRQFGAEITLASMGQPLSTEQRAEVSALDHVELHESSYRLCWMPDAEEDLERAADWLQTLAAKTSPDLVHLNDLGAAHLSWPAPVVLVAHSCV